MRSELSSGKYDKRHPLDWYVEEGWEWDQVVRAIGVRQELEDGAAIWDPAAGFGRAGSRLEDWGFSGRVILSDLVDNVAWDEFRSRPVYFAADFLDLTEPPASPVSIFTNPPYSYRKYNGMSTAEAFVRHALKLATHRVVILVPSKWLASQGRHALFMSDAPPQFVLHFSQRPSMPPGDYIEKLGSRAHRGGKVDFCSIVWNLKEPTAPGETRTVWLPPLAGGSR